MHPRNRHQSRYDLIALCKSFPVLRTHLIVNKYGDHSIDFSNPLSVKVLNQAILKSFYDVDWELPEKFLCPPIPGRADYIHSLADLVGPQEKNVNVLDVGVGANCVYPIIGHSEYGWHFVGSDVNREALAHAEKILSMNPKLQGDVELRLQENPQNIFKNIIRPGEKFHITLCNPPFHSSAKEALAGTERKWKNLGKNKNQTKTLNFGGIGAELWTKGGEKSFIQTMIQESKLYSEQVGWFTSLVSKGENLPFITKLLSEVNASDVKLIDMSQGQKKSRIVAWTF